MQKSNTGFTLIELIIAVSIVSILAVIAVPSYQKHMQRSNRTDAISAMMRIAAEQEKFYFQNSRYGSMVELGSPTTEHGLYTLFIFGNNANNFTAMAMPPVSSPQFNDTDCRRFMMTAAGIRIAFDSANQPADDCWR